MLSELHQFTIQFYTEILIYMKLQILLFKTVTECHKNISRYPASGRFTMAVT